MFHIPNQHLYNLVGDRRETLRQQRFNNGPKDQLGHSCGTLLECAAGADLMHLLCNLKWREALIKRAFL